MSFLITPCSLIGRHIYELAVRQTVDSLWLKSWINCLRHECEPVFPKETLFPAFQPAFLPPKRIYRPTNQWFLPLAWTSNQEKLSLEAMWTWKRKANWNENKQNIRRQTVIQRIKEIMNFDFVFWYRVLLYSPDWPPDLLCSTTCLELVVFLP